MKDYVCCDIHLDSMHELLQHYEEAHAQQPNQTIGRTPQEQRLAINRPANATITAQSVQQQSEDRGGPPQTSQLGGATSFNPVPSPMFDGASVDQISTFDNLDDMEMDEGATGLQTPLQSTPQTSQQQLQQQQQSQGSQYQPQPQFGRQQPRAPAVNVNIANAFQGHNLNAQTPTTPHANTQIFGLPNNPTVSSVNTPTLSTQTVSQRLATPDSSTPGTPADLDLDISQLSNLGFDYNTIMQSNLDFSSLNLNQINGASGTIDDPAKRLLSKQGFGNKGFPASALHDGELAKRVRENQLLNGLAGAGGFVGEEIKPFRCPVIGCEKAYKNQNGLKYHKQHGHQNQQLKENPDGSFSIVDPTTSIPYPGTLGMEKEKPYRCEVCGKRYKNLNGLKYHRQHSPPCNPELKLGAQGVPALSSDVSGLNVNVAGAGLSGLAMGY